MSRFVTLHEVFDTLGIPYKTVQELNRMTPEEREEYLKEHTWSRGERDSKPIDFALSGEISDEGRLLLYFDDRWTEGRKL